MHPVARFSLSLIPCLSLGACSIVSDLDRFSVSEDAGSFLALDVVDGGGDDGGDGGQDAGDPGLGCQNFRTLCLRMDGMDPHLNQVTIVDLVSETDNLRARAILEVYGPNPQTDIVLPLAIPEGDIPDPEDDHPLHLEIWADQTQDGEYTPDGDHDWDEPLSPKGNIIFTHNTEFDDLLPRPREIGGDFVMTLTDINIHEGQQVEIMVIEAPSGRAVGLYRIPRYPADVEKTITIPGIIDLGVAYRVEFYADANDNRTYDDSPVDHTWVLTGEAGADGDFRVEFTHGTTFENLDYQFDFEL